MLPLRGIIFLLLNAVRTISIVSLILLFAAVITLMVQDSKAYFALRQTSRFATYSNEYCYFPDTEVPTSTWGLFWLQLDRFYILMIAIICALSEITIPIIRKTYDRFLPILGTPFSTAPLGIIQMMTSASLLSHYQEGFPLRVAWLLFFIGMINFLLGIAFRREIRLRRSLLRSKREQFHNPAVAQPEKGETHIGSYISPAITPSVTMSNRRPSSTHSIRGQPAAPIRTPLDAFSRPGPSKSYAASEDGMSIHPQRVNSTVSSRASVFMRERAREENKRVELADEFRWNSKCSMPIERAEILKSPTPPASVSDQINELQHRIQTGQAGVTNDLKTDESTGVKGAFQRRSLVLSKALRQVKRASVASMKRKAPRRSKVPAMPIRYATSSKKPSEWVEVDKSPDLPSMPPVSYMPSRATDTMYEDLGSTRTRYHTPIADRYI